jgi:hypothetical protein
VNKHPRPSLPKVSEQMKAWSAALAAELNSWPKVTTRPMFGFTAYYRRARIFAVLPKTRGMSTPNSLAFKLEAPPPEVRARMRADPRLSFTEMAQARWLRFEMSSDADLRAALEWLSQAYEATGKSLRSR